MDVEVLPVRDKGLWSVSRASFMGSRSVSRFSRKMLLCDLSGSSGIKSGSTSDAWNATNEGRAYILMHARNVRAWHRGARVRPLRATLVPASVSVRQGRTTTGRWVG